MKKLHLILILFFVAANTFAQDYKVLLNSRKFTPKENLVSILTAKKLDQSSYFDNKNYVVLQFKKTLNESEKIVLKNAGIALLDYLPNFAYTATIAANTDLYILYNLNLRSLFYLDIKDKAAPSLLAAKVPRHAVKQNGFADIRILTYDLINNETVAAALATYKTKIIEAQPVFKNFIIRVPINQIKKIAALPFVQWLEFIDPPNQAENLLGRSLHRVNILQDGVRNLKGDGMNIAVFDERASQHLDFSPAGRMINEDAGAAGSHGSHVSGTVGGKGIIDPIAKGMAPNATIYSYYGFSGDVQARMATEIPAKTLISSNHSYHDGLGVQCGVTGASAGYSLRARNTDINLNNNLYHLHCHSSGNNQAGCASGWGTITGTGKAAKNNIVVGNITSTEVLSTSSSCGPVHDGRVKPEIVAMGTNVYSTYTPINTYATISGTSMSTPGVTGTVALLAQHYKQLNGNVLPPSALIKNVICNTATDLGNVGPDYRFGFGRINALKSAKIIEQNRYALDNVTTSTIKNITITVPANAVKLNVMLTWNDPAAAANAAIAIVNDLDLQVINGTTTSLPWILNPASPATPATRAVNTVSNIEQVTIDNPTAGTYTLRVIGTNVPVGANQTYALTWDVDVPNIEIIYPNGNEKFRPSTTETITWDNAGVTSNQVLEYSLDGSTNWINIGTVASNVTRFAWTVPVANTSTAKVRITSGTLTDASDAGFNILGAVVGFTANGTSCNAGEVSFSWSAVTGATAYDLFILNPTTGNFDLLAANISTQTYTATGLTPNSTRWFTIVAKNAANSAVSERARAISAVVSNGGGGLAALGGINGTSSVCGNVSVNYNVPAIAGASSYTWTPPTGAVVTSGQGTNNIVVTYNAGSTSSNISVVASNGTCNTAPSTLAVVVGSSSEQAVAGPNQSQNICPGNAVPTLTATGTSPIGTTLVWYDALTGGSIVTNPILNSVGTITYYASARNNSTLCESAIRNPTTLTITSTAPAQINATGQTTFCTGGSVTLTAAVGSSYSWSNGATTQSITVINSGNFNCVVNANGCTTTSNTIPVTVNVRPTASVTAASGTTFCLPNTVTLTASPASSWQWSNGATTQSIQVNASGNYTVVTTGANGCTSATSNSIVVNAGAQPILNITASPYTSLLPGIKTTISVNVQPAATYSYVWKKDGQIVTGSTLNELTIGADKTGLYEITATNASGCSNKSQIQIGDSSSTNLYVLPNPSNGVFDVIYYAATSGNHVLSVYDSKGANVYRKTFAITQAYQRMNVDLSRYSSGSYMVVLLKNNKKIAERKVIKN
jgi:hypothetical protein